jgi:hypothetical protein
MKKLLAITAAVLVLTSSAANAWTDRFGHWYEGPPPPLTYHYQYGAAVPRGYYPPPAYYPVPPVYYPAPVVVVPPPTDAEVIAGTVLGIVGMFANGRHW